MAGAGGPDLCPVSWYPLRAFGTTKGGRWSPAQVDVHVFSADQTKEKVAEKGVGLGGGFVLLRTGRGRWGHFVIESGGLRGSWNRNKHSHHHSPPAEFNMKLTCVGTQMVLHVARHFYM